MASAHELSARYARYVSAQLSGDDIETVDFGLWLDAHWCNARADGSEPCMDDTGGHSARHCAVAWIEQDGVVIGVLAGLRQGCYRVSIGERVPEIALMLDDVNGCSTGSIHQERAVRYVSAPSPMEQRLRTSRRTTAIPWKILPIAPPPMPSAPEFGLGEAY